MVAADQLSKAWARANLASSQIDLIDGFLSLRLVYNTGAAFGIFPGGRWVFLAVAPPVALGVALWSMRAAHLGERIAAALMLGGIFGNSWDRLLAPDGRVTDFVDFSFWPAFNLADSALVVGLVTYGLSLLVLSRRSSDAGRSTKNQEVLEGKDGLLVDALDEGDKGPRADVVSH